MLVTNLVPAMASLDVHPSSFKKPNSSSSVDSDYESEDEIPSQTAALLRVKRVSTIRRLSSSILWPAPIGLRLLPIVFLCNFLEVVHVQIVMTKTRHAGDWLFSSECIKWTANGEKETCTEAGFFIAMAISMQQFLGPVIGL
jgi:hypothetical protein